LTKRILTVGIAALTLAAAMAPAIGAVAQDNHYGDHADSAPMNGGGERDHVNGGGDHRGWNHGNGYGRGYGDRGYGDRGGGFGLGVVLGTYAGRPYYCRHHHHWRWNHRQDRYGYDYSRGGYC